MHRREKKAALDSWRHIPPEVQQDVDEVWWRVGRPMMQDVEEMKRVVYDYWTLIQHTTLIFHYATGGEVTDPHTPVDMVIGAIDKYNERFCEDCKQEMAREHMADK